MFQVHLVDSTSNLFEEVQQKAVEIYRSTLGIEPISNPPRYIAVLSEGLVVGSVGIWLGSERAQLSVEMFFQHTVTDPRADRVIDRVVCRSEIAEATALNIERRFRGGSLPALLFGAVYRYLRYTAKVKVLLLIQARTLNVTFKKIGTKVERICPADLRYYSAPDDVKDALQRVYFAKLKPWCTLVTVNDALAAYEEVSPDLEEGVFFGKEFSE